MTHVRKHTPFYKELQVAIEAAKAAGCYLSSNRTLANTKHIKSNPKDFVTEQDICTEKIILDIIQRQFPHDSILSEESFSNLTKDTRVWIIDPLDGTRNYANDIPHFSVSIAFFCDNEVKVGVVHTPCCNNEIFFAEKNQGAFFNGQPLQMVNPSQLIETSIVATGFSYFRGEELTTIIKAFEKVINITLDVVRLGSAAADLCYVAVGRFGAYYEFGLKPWDIAAAMLILKEARGVLSNYKGNTINLFAKNANSFCLNVLASKNPQIHERLLNVFGSFDFNM